MKLFAYYQQDYNGFVLFFNDHITIRRANVENINGLRDLLFSNDIIQRLEHDSMDDAKELLKEILLRSIITIEEIDRLVSL